MGNLRRLDASRAVLLSLALALPGALGEECSSTCGMPSDLPFCSYVSFAVCGSGASWEELDARASSAFDAWSSSNTSISPLAKLPQYQAFSEAKLKETVEMLDLSNTSSKCGAFLHRMECAVHFPVCEAGHDVTRVCLQSCEGTVHTQCLGLSGMCTSEFSENEVESKGKCFDMDYKGPAVGMWVAGFLISLIFSILNSVGINLQKLSMSRNDAAEVKKGTFKQPLWVLGFALVCLGSLLDFVAFGMAPQTLLAPLAALSLVWNMFIAPIFHKEKVTQNNLIATCIIFTGVTLTVIFAGHNTPTYELEDLIRLYQQPAMYAYISLIVCFLAGLFSFCRYIERSHVYEGGLYHIICYGGIAGTFGGQSVLLAKSTVELLKSAIWGDAGSYMFTQVASYLIIGGLAACLGSQIHFLNGGLARFDALVVIPVYQSFWILTSVLGGIMYFEEYVHMTSKQMFMFTVGGIVTILGIIVLLKTRQKDSAEKTGRYVEVALTPTAAWDIDDSDEDEEIELKLPNNCDELSSPIRTSPTKVFPGTVKGTTNSTKKSVEEDDDEDEDLGVTSASRHAKRISPTAGNRGKGASSKVDEDDDEDFI